MNMFFGTEWTVLTGINTIPARSGTKTVTVIIPEPKVISTNVNVDTLDYIFMKDKYNTTGLTDEALKLCRQDLKNELENTPEIFRIAQENAETAVKQLLEPWLKNVDSEYTIIVK